MLLGDDIYVYIYIYIYTYIHIYHLPLAYYYYNSFKLWLAPLPNGRLLRPKMYADQSLAFSKTLLQHPPSANLRSLMTLWILSNFPHIVFFQQEGPCCHACCAYRPFIEPKDKHAYAFDIGRQHLAAFMCGLVPDVVRCSAAFVNTVPYLVVLHWLQIATSWQLEIIQ